MNWHYTSNGKQFGPSSEAEIRFHISSGSISTADKVKPPGLNDWIPSGEAHKYFGLSSQNSTPQSSAESSQLITCSICKKEYYGHAKVCVHCGAKNPNKMGAGSKFGIFVLAIVGIFIALLIIGNLAYDPEQHAAEEAIAQCHKIHSDELLGIGARRLARDTCDLMEQRYKDKYGRAP